MARRQQHGGTRALASLLLAGLATAPLLAQTQPIEVPANPALDLRLAPDDPASNSLTPPATEADPNREERTRNASDLEAVEASLTLSQDRIAALKAEIAGMEGDRTRQNATLIAAAQRVKMAETEVAAIEDRLSELIVKELEVRGRLDGADAEIANVLAALQRVSLNPPPALIVDPQDALGSARGAMLIAAIVPQLRAKADAVAADLKELQDIKSAALAEEATLKTNYEVLQEEQLRIATLIAARREGLDQKSEELEAEQREAVALAERAGSLRELIEALSRRTLTNQVPADASPPALSADAARVAFANLARTEPAVPFPLARGYLTQPANGVVALAFGANDGRGGIAQGNYLVTRAEAQVVAPADGWVLYKGPYLNYGQIIILNTGSGYTALLAGLETITVDIGQFVMMGEPLGTMGSRTIGRTVSTSAGADQPTLYIEFRQNNRPFDPQGWWAQSEQTG